MYYLFLDDERIPQHVRWIKLPACAKWDIVRTYDDFVAIIERRGMPAFVSYDHDLGPQAYEEMTRNGNKDFDYSRVSEKTGYDCAKYLIDKCLDAGIEHPNHTVHSMNIVGKQNIESLIASYHKSFIKV